MVFSRIVAQIRRPVRPGALFAIVIEPGVMITEHLTGGLFDMYYSVEVRLRPSPERLQQSTKLLHPLHQQFPFNVVVHKPRANNSTLLSSFYAWLDRWKVCVTQHTVRRDHLANTACLRLLRPRGGCDAVPPSLTSTFFELLQGEYIKL